MNRAAMVTGEYEKFKESFVAFIQNLPDINANKYIKANIDTSKDYLTATISYLDATFHLRLSIASRLDKLYGVACTYLSETNEETLIMKHHFDSFGMVHDEKPEAPVQWDIGQNEFPKEFMSNLADAYLGQMEKRYKA